MLMLYSFFNLSFKYIFILGVGDIWKFDDETFPHLFYFICFLCLYIFLLYIPLSCYILLYQFKYINVLFHCMSYTKLYTVYNSVYNKLIIKVNTYSYTITINFHIYNNIKEYT